MQGCASTVTRTMAARRGGAGRGEGEGASTLISAEASRGRALERRTSTLALSRGAQGFSQKRSTRRLQGREKKGGEGGAEQGEERVGEGEKEQANDVVRAYLFSGCAGGTSLERGEREEEPVFLGCRG